MRNPVMDIMDKKLIMLDGLYYLGSLPIYNCHDLWLFPCYKRPPHEIIDNDRADRGGRRVVRIDDRESEGQAILNRLEIIKKKNKSDREDGV